MKNEIQLLKDAAMEIKILRRQNELMSARLEVFDSMMAVLHTTVAYKGQGMSPDIVFAMEKTIAESEGKETDVTVTNN